MLILTVHHVILQCSAVNYHTAILQDDCRNSPFCSVVHQKHTVLNPDPLSITMSIKRYQHLFDKRRAVKYLILENNILYLKTYCSWKKYPIFRLFLMYSFRRHFYTKEKYTHDKCCITMCTRTKHQIHELTVTLFQTFFQLWNTKGHFLNSREP